jgi:hypothetical protein
METKIIYRGPKKGVDRFTISATGNFKGNVRRALELCKDMGIEQVEFEDDINMTACIETGIEGVICDRKRRGTVVTVPNDVKDGLYEGSSPEKLRMQAYKSLMQGKTSLTYNRLCPGAITKNGTTGPLFHLIKEMNYRIGELGHTLMALEKVAPSKWQILAKQELPEGCEVSEFKDKEGNCYLLVQNVAYEEKKRKVFRLNLQKKYRVYRVNPHTGKQQLSKVVDAYTVLVMPGDADLLRFQDAEEEAYFIEYALKK